jgi:hypothetical protein
MDFSFGIPNLMPEGSKKGGSFHCEGCNPAKWAEIGSKWVKRKDIRIGMTLKPRDELRSGVFYWSRK